MKRFVDRWTADATPLTTAAVITVALVLQLPSLLHGAPEFFVDDAGFFFRYAESIAAGEGYRFNSGEAPVWGASAPLWPLVLAVGLASGLSIESSVHLFAIAFTLCSVGFLTAAALRSAGWIAGFAFGVFAAVNFRLTFWAMSGLESPQSYLPIALGIFAMVFRRHGLLLGLSIGVCAVQKLDLVPFSLALAVAAVIERRSLPLPALALATVIVLAWYGFAWVHFDSILPNTVLVKIQTSHPPLPAGWFSETALFSGVRRLFAVLALASLPHLWRRERGAGIAALVFIAIQVGIYTFNPPAETWGWYTAPIQPVLCWLAALGVAELVRLSRLIPLKAAPASVHALAGLGLLVALGAWGWSLDGRARLQRWGNAVIGGTLVEAGRWVDERAAPDWKVMSHFGTPIYYAGRYAIDHTRLNRADEPRSAHELLLEYRPEVIVAANSALSLPVDDFLPRSGYRIARVFRRANPFLDFYSIVEVRNDLPPLAGEMGRAHEIVQVEEE